MSDEENENADIETKDPVVEDDAPDVTIPEEALAFLEKLKQNQIAQARSALINTLCDDPGQTIGSILEALETDDDGDYIMLEMFKKLSIDDLILSVAGGLKNGAPDVPAPLDEVVAARASIEKEHAALSDDEEEDELNDDDEFDDDGSSDDEVTEATPPPKSKKKKKSKKSKKDKKEKKKAQERKAKKDDEPKEDKTPKGKVAKNKKVSKKDILRHLREVKAKSEDSAVSSSTMQKALNCDADVLRPLLAELLEDDKIEKYGKARGTKYCRA